MRKKEKKIQHHHSSTISMKGLFKRYLMLLGILVGTGVIFVIILTVIYLIDKDIELIYTMLIGTLIFSVLIILATVSYYRTIRNTYLDEMFSKTIHNYEALSSNQKSLVSYKNTNVKEFDELNNYIDLMKATYKNVTLASKPVTYEQLNLEYPDPEDKHLITMESFNLNYRNFVLISDCYRDAFLVFNIEADVEIINDSDYKCLIGEINKYIPVEEKLYAISSKRGAVLVFVPNIDSISFYEEAMNKIVKGSIIYDYQPTGVNMIKVRSAMVVYPYSNIHDLMDDLRYADRQGKRVNIYLPERLNKTNKDFMHNTLILNNMTKVYSEFNRIDMHAKDSREAIKKGTALMRNVRVNMEFENCGTIMHEDISNKYYCTYDDVDDEQNRLFEVNSTVANEFIEAIQTVADADNSYYFSKRDRASDILGKYLDAYGIRSGQFFLAIRNNRVKACIFFLNKTKDCYLTAYTHELLYVFCTYLGWFNKQLTERKHIDSANSRVKDILRLSEIDMYTIEKSTYRLVFVSDALDSTLGGLKLGDKCYKAIYGFDEPCENCPLTTLRKMRSIIKGVECNSSNVLSRKRSPFTTILIQHAQAEDYNTNRFHNDLMIFSSYALADRMNSLYSASVRGSLILISIDNCEKLVEEYHNEGYFLRIRGFIDEIKQRLNLKFDIFAYSDDTLAIIFNEEGRVDVIKECELIYNISQNLMMGSIGQYKIDPTFIVFDFPRDYPTPVEFTRSINRYVKSNKDKFGHNLIIVPSQNYERPASREDFVLDVLNKAFERDALTSKLLPVIAEDDKTVIGAEMLLRLGDEFLNVSIPAYEFIEVARKNGLIFKISNYLIDYLGKTYQKYGVTTFKSTGLRFFSINTELSFFQDENFLTSIGEIMMNYHLPKGFLAFEITESDLAANFEFYRSIYRRILGYDILLVADNYTGKELSLDRLKEIGVSNVKVSRMLVSKIDSDVKRYNELKDILDDCEDEGIKACIVGVENQKQHMLLNEYKTKFQRQGYFYGEPIDIDEFIELMKQNLSR